MNIHMRIFEILSNYVYSVKITMTMTFHLFRHLLTNQVHNIFKNIDFPSKYNGIGHVLETS